MLKVSVDYQKIRENTWCTEQGDLLKGIDNYSGVAWSMVQVSEGNKLEITWYENTWTF